MKKQLNKNLSSLIRTSIYPQTTQPSSPAWKRPIYLICFVSSMWDIFQYSHFQISSCKQLNSKEQTWKLQIHSIMSQFTTLNVRAILSVPDSAAFCVLFSTFYSCSRQSSISRDHPQEAVIERQRLWRGGHQWRLDCNKIPVELTWLNEVVYFLLSFLHKHIARNYLFIILSI